MWNFSRAVMRVVEAISMRKIKKSKRLKEVFRVVKCWIGNVETEVGEQVFKRAEEQKRKKQ